MNTAVSIPPAKGVFIDNRWRPAASGRTLPMVAPAEGAVFASIAAGDKADIDLAVAAARKAFETGAWGRLNAVERGRLLLKLGRLIEEHVRGTRPAGGARHRQADEAGARRRGRDGALFRILRRRGRQAARRHDTVPRRLLRHDGLGAQGRHGAHHSLELSRPDVRPHDRRRRSPSATPCVLKPAEEACLAPLRLAELVGRSRLSRGRAQCRAGPRRGGGRGARRPSRHRFHLVHRQPGGRARWCRPRPRAIISAARWSSAASRRSSCSPTPIWDAALATVVNAIVQNAGQTCSAGSRRARRAQDLGPLHGGPRFALRQGQGGNAGNGPRARTGDLRRAEEADRGHARAPPKRSARCGWPRAKSPTACPKTAFSSRRRSTRRTIRPPRWRATKCSARSWRRCRSRTRRTPCGSPTRTDYGLVAGVWSGDGNRAMRVARKVRAGPGVRQRLWRGRRHRTAVRRHEEIRPRPREGFRRALRHGGAEDAGVQTRVGVAP